MVLQVHVGLLFCFLSLECSMQPALSMVIRSADTQHSLL